MQPELLNHLDKLHTTEMGHERIRKNLNLDVSNTVERCKNFIQTNSCNIVRKGKNWYINNKEIIITVNAYSFTIITAHKIACTLNNNF